MEHVNIKKNILKENGRRGFSILEAVIALFLVSFGMIGIISLNNQNLQVKINNKNGFIASMLAQEGLEIARNRRDSKWIDGSNPGLSAGTYALDQQNISSVSGIEAAGSRLKYNTAGFYCAGDWTISGENYACNQGDSPFSRVVTVTNQTGYQEVLSVVRFTKAGNNYDYTAATRFYEWN